MIPVRLPPLICACLVLLAATGAAAAAADDYPSRPVRLVVPFPTGGAMDFTGRILAGALGAGFNQQFVVDNRGGAGGASGLRIGAAAAPDGYTLLFANIGSIAVIPALSPQPGLNPGRDLAAVSQFAEVASALIVHPGLPVQNTRELVDYIRARPGKLNFASPGQAFEMEIFNKAAGLAVTHVPYKGAGPAALSVASGETQFMLVTLPSVTGLLKDGRLRLLAVKALSRSPLFPEAPTMAEAGYPAMTGGSWQGLFVPKKTPPALVATLFRAVRDSGGRPEVKQRLANGGAQAVLSASPADFERFVAAQIAQWGRVIAESGAGKE